MLDEKVKKRNRQKFIALLVLMFSPIVISYVLFYSDYRPGTVNYGELLEVEQPLKGEGVNPLNNKIFRMKDLKGKWVMLTVDSGSCDKACQDKLYYMRQVRTVQHKEKHRVERLWLITDDVKPADELVKEYEGTHFVKTDDRALLDAIPPKEGQTKHIYMIDPLGNLMMRYPEKLNPTKMGKDIKRLLHVSQLEH